MDELVEKIQSAIVFRTYTDGKVRRSMAKGSSIELPEIDEEKTRINIENVMGQLLLEIHQEPILSQLNGAVRFVKSFYTLTHDGFRASRTTDGSRTLKVSDVYAFSIAAGFCYDCLPLVPHKRSIRVGIGVMAPAIQDCGKNLIKLIWKVAGFDVIDFGNTVRPDIWLSEIVRLEVSAVGVSCMSNKCITNLRKLLNSLAYQGVSLPVVIGGIATNRVMAFELTKEYGLPVYYGCDVKDAATALEKALAKVPVEVPEIKNIEKLDIPPGPSGAESHGFRLFKIRLSDIVINQDARRGCSHCSGDKNRLCPLEIGYEQQKSLEESHQFVNSFKFGVLVLADIPDESDRSKCKSLWEDLLTIEQHFSSTFNSANAFKFPMTCPFCVPKECKLHKGECMFPSLYRPLHEQYNINIPETLRKVFGDAGQSGICSIILVC